MWQTKGGDAPEGRDMSPAPKFRSALSHENSVLLEGFIEKRCDLLAKGATDPSCPPALCWGERVRHTHQLLFNFRQGVRLRMAASIFTHHKYGTQIMRPASSSNRRRGNGSGNAKTHKYFKRSEAVAAMVIQRWQRRVVQSRLETARAREEVASRRWAVDKLHSAYAKMWRFEVAARRERRQQWEEEEVRVLRTVVGVCTVRMRVCM